MPRFDPPETVTPAAFQGLRLLAWNRDPTVPIPARDAFALYERNWRHLDQSTLTRDEIHLIEDLACRFGRGRILA